MDFSVIKEIGSAFLVGATVLLVIEACLYFCASWTITGFFRLPIGIDSGHPRPESSGTKDAVGGVQLGAFVGVATILGVLCQSAFQPLIDSADYPIHAVPTFVSRLMCNPDASAMGCLPDNSSKNNLRMNVLYEHKLKEGSKDEYEIHPTTLTNEIAQQAMPERYCPQTGVSKLPTTLAKSAAGEKSGTDEKRDLKADRACLVQLFFLSKNWASGQQTYYDELMRVQGKIDFARSFSLVTISLLPWMFVFFFGGLTARTLGQWNANLAAPVGRLVRLARNRFGLNTPFGLRSFLVGCALVFFFSGVVGMWLFDWVILAEADKHPRWASIYFALAAGLAALLALALVKREREWATDWPSLHRSAGLMALLSATLLVLHVMGYDAYAWDEEEFAKRAYGYFVTHDALEPKREGVFDGLRWFRDSAERRAAYLQTYRDAAAYLATYLKEHATELKSHPWGVILDLDETVLDNSDYQRQLAVTDKRFEPLTWDTWVRSKQAGLLPGAKEFIDQVTGVLQGKVALVTNRSEPQCAVTEANLKALQVRYDRILCASGSDDKNERFRRIGEEVTVLAWIGDNIQDFPHLSQQTPSDMARFGSGYFVLPNPMYGSWQTRPGK